MDVLIIEDSLAIIILFKNFLKKLGINHVYYTQKGLDGIVLFRKLVRAGKNPLVFLDYELGDTDGLVIISQILQIKPDTKVIIETARERSDETVKKLLSSGAYDYLEKPVHFENIKKLLNVLNIENNLNNPESSSGTEIIDYIIQSSNLLSLTKLIETTHLKPQIILEHLAKLESDNVVKNIGTIREICCNSCDSVNLNQLFYCPNCKGSNFKQGRLIEHYDCGYVALSDEFENNTCPQCNKQLKARGVDHKRAENYYNCLDCDNNFAEPYSKYLCQKCNKRFTIDDTKWVTSPYYEVLQNSSELKCVS